MWGLRVFLVSRGSTELVVLKTEIQMGCCLNLFPIKAKVIKMLDKCSDSILNRINLTW